MIPGKDNLFIEMGAGFSKEFDYSDETGAPVDMSKWTGQVVIKHFRDSTDSILLLDAAPSLTLGAAGEIHLELTAEETAAIELPAIMEWGPVNGTYGRIGIWVLRLIPDTAGVEPFDLLMGLVVFLQNPIPAEV